MAIFHQAIAKIAVKKLLVIINATGSSFFSAKEPMKVIINANVDKIAIAIIYLKNSKSNKII